MIRIIFTSIIKKFIFLFFSLLLFFIFPKKVEATFSFNIASSSATVITSGGQDIEVGLNVLDLPNESYFRVSLQKESGGSYYGYILNSNGDWAKIQTLSGDCTAYYKITDLSIKSLLLKYHIGDDTEIPNGNYYLKAHRFTKTCTSYTEATNFLSLEVNLPTPTPTPTMTPIPTTTSEPTATPLPTNTPINTPTATSTPLPTNAPIPTLKITPTIKPTPTFAIVLNPTESLGMGTEPPGDLSAEDILGMEASSGGEASSSSNFSGFIKNIPWFPVIAVGIGVLFIGFSLFTFIKGNRKIPPPNL